MITEKEFKDFCRNQISCIPSCPFWNDCQDTEFNNSELDAYEDMAWEALSKYWRKQKLAKLLK